VYIREVEFSRCQLVEWSEWNFVPSDWKHFCNRQMNQGLLIIGARKFEVQNLEVASLVFSHSWGCANSIPSPPGIKTFERSWVSEPDAWSSWPEKTCLRLALVRYSKAILLTKTHESRIWLYPSHNLAINALTPWAFTCCKLYHTKTGQARSSGWGALRLPGRLHSL